MVLETLHTSRRISYKIAVSKKEARVCVSNAFVIEDSKFKWWGFFAVEDEQVTEEADMLMWI